VTTWHSAEEMSGKHSLPLAEENLEKLRWARGGGFDLEVVPSAPSTEGFGEMKELVADTPAVAAARCDLPAGGDAGGAGGGVLAEADEKSGDFPVVNQPIEAEFDGLSEPLGSNELAPHRGCIRGGDHGAD